MWPMAQVWPFAPSRSLSAPWLSGAVPVRGSCWLARLQSRRERLLFQPALGRVQPARSLFEQTPSDAAGADVAKPLSQLEAVQPPASAISRRAQKYSRPSASLRGVAHRLELGLRSASMLWSA